MRLSVITPIFNCSRFIEGCIHSVNRQTRRVEHIVVDGGSSDGILQCLAKFDYLKWISEPDDGMYDAINKGIALSSGDVVGYLNADDRYYPYTVENVLSVFESNPQVDFVYGHCTFVDLNGNRLYTFKTLPYIGYMLRNMRHIPWAQPSCFWRRTVHDKVGYFDPAVKFCGDHMFFRRLLMGDFKGYRINAPLSYFMIHDTSLSVKYRREMAEEAAIVREHHQCESILMNVTGQLVLKLINAPVYARRLQSWLRQDRSG